MTELKKRSKVEKNFKITKAKLWFFINLICSIVYLTWRIFFTIPIGYGVVSVCAGIFLLVVEGLGVVEAIIHYVNMNNAEEYKKPIVPLELFPDVDIFVATYNESPELLEKTLLACKRMDYPDLEKVHIYLCDDGRRASMKELARKIGVNYLDRQDNAGAKAGNLNNALAHSNSPYIVTFDADMIPQSCFLMETIPYFVDANLRNKGKREEEQIKLGFLQSPQSFYDVDLFQFNLHSEGKIPNEQDYFYRDIEVARTKTNSCIYGGSNTVLAREALETIGGFYTDAVTEDFATGILIQKAGYVSLGISKILASGVSAKKLQDLIQQRVRWARGVISTGRKMHIYTSKDLSIGQKLNYWASIWYWYAPIKRLCYILSPILYGAFGFMVFRCTLWQVLLFWLPMYVTSNISLRMLSNNIRNTKWTAIYEYTLFPYLIIPVILETFGFSLKKFKVTSKDSGKNHKDQNIVYMVPHIILFILSIISVIRCVVVIFTSGSLGPIVVLFWLIYNLYAMFMCLFFVDGREIYRTSDRVYIKLDGTLHFDGKSYEIQTKDISETGIALYMDKPILIDSMEKRMPVVEISDRRWKSKLYVEVKHTKEFPDKEDKRWLYTFAIKDFLSYDDYDQYLAILYDRVPLNPMKIKRNNSIYDDLSTNISRRVTIQDVLKRHYPRIEVNCLIPFRIDGKIEKIKVNNFNYQYFATSSNCHIFDNDNENENNKEIVVIIDNYELPVVFETQVNKAYLFKVIDFEKIYFDDKLRDDIMEALLSIISNSKNKISEATVDVVEPTDSKKEFDEMNML